MESLDCQAKETKMYPTDNRRLGRFLRKAAADHFRRHHHFPSSCCPWQSGPFLPLARRGWDWRPGMWSEGGSLATAGDILSGSLTALGMLCPGQNQAALGTAQGVPTDELL